MVLDISIALRRLLALKQGDVEAQGGDLQCPPWGGVYAAGNPEMFSKLSELQARALVR